MKALSIIIPCYNEAGNIPLIVKRLKETIGDSKDIEIVLVDNGSTDDSAAILQRELAVRDMDAYHVVTVPVNKGYGYGILAGLDAAHGDVLAWTHADMQTDPGDVLRAYEVYKEHAGRNILVKGKRKNRSFTERAFTYGMQLVANAFLRTKLDDINAQPKLFSRVFYDQYMRGSAPHDFSLDLYALYQARRHCDAILEVPVFFSKRRYGEAKGGGSWRTRLKLILRTFSYIYTLRKKIQVP